MIDPLILWGVKNVIYAGLGGFGYMSRQLGSLETDKSWLLRWQGIFLIGLPFGVFSGHLAETYVQSTDLPILPYVSAYLGGSLAYNILTTLWKPDKWLYNLKSLISHISQIK